MWCWHPELTHHEAYFFFFANQCDCRHASCLLCPKPPQSRLLYTHAKMHTDASAHTRESTHYTRFWVIKKRQDPMGISLNRSHQVCFFSSGDGSSDRGSACLSRSSPCWQMMVKGRRYVIASSDWLRGRSTDC